MKEEEEHKDLPTPETREIPFMEIMTMIIPPMPAQ
jgi:hypothetical protein